MNGEPRITDLTCRERQIMDIIYRLGSATAVDVVNNLPGEPVNATVRSMLSVLEEKGFLRHEADRGRFIYSPTIRLEVAQKTVLKNLLETFFAGAEAQAVIAILSQPEARLNEAERRHILDLIAASRDAGR
jgi:predicted transcriptional regulator